MLIEQAEILGALTLGVCPSGDVEKMLNSLSSEEAHSAKRKFRKLKRQLIKENSMQMGISSAVARRLVRMKCIDVGMEILNKS
jgi:hypothetical protein